MEVFKIKHIPTGLFWQPHKHRGSTLSKTGKMYPKRSFAEAAMKCVHVQVAENSVVHRLAKNVLNFEPIKWSPGQLRYLGKKEDWEIVQF